MRWQRPTSFATRMTEPSSSRRTILFKASIGAPDFSKIGIAKEAAVELLSQTSASSAGTGEASLDIYELLRT